MTICEAWAYGPKGCWVRLPDGNGRFDSGPSLHFFALFTKRSLNR